MKDLELLALQAEMSLDDRGRLEGTRGVTIAVTRDGQMLFVGSDVPDPLVPALVAAVERSPLASAPEREPPALGVCRAILALPGAPLSLAAGPSYRIEPGVGFETPSQIVRSDSPVNRELRRLNPGNWENEEWDDL
ncbi:MAG: hypothetical protein ACYDCQ_21355, partial [Dehalococcoidia bacterium]